MPTWSITNALPVYRLVRNAQISKSVLLVWQESSCTYRVVWQLVLRNTLASTKYVNPVLLPVRLAMSVRLNVSHVCTRIFSRAVPTHALRTVATAFTKSTLIKSVSHAHRLAATVSTQRILAHLASVEKSCTKVNVWSTVLWRLTMTQSLALTVLWYAKPASHRLTAVTAYRDISWSTTPVRMCVLPITT